MRIFNTYSGTKEELTPLEPGKISMYSCGPTVYRYIHIGNLRTFSMADWLRRALLRQGFTVQHIKNITDVGHMRVERLDAGEDKLLAQARKERRPAGELAAFYTEAFLEDERRLNIMPADTFPRATAHVPEMIRMIERLEHNELAYVADGNVFFDTRRFARYGELSGNRLGDAQSGVQELVATGKRNPEDFPLWKAAEPNREMVWNSPWGAGFPGWHIECSAMATRYLGERFDIHTGGVDNIFPHHENEIAQSEGALGHRWVSYWVHAQHLLTDGLKMAKSTGNDYTLDEIVGRGYEPLALRYLFTTAHYRSRLNFTFTALSGAQIALRRLRLLTQRWSAAADTEVDAAALAPWHAAFDAALADDLNLPQAMRVVWTMARAPEAALRPAERAALLADWDRVLALDLSAPADPQPDAPEALVAALAERTAARAAGNYAEADRIRATIAAAGFDVRDGRSESLLARQQPGAGMQLLTSSQQVPDQIGAADRFGWSVNLIARNNRDDLARCLASIARYAGTHAVEVVLIDNGSTDDTLAYVRDLAREPQLTRPDGSPLPLQVLFADHNLGFAGGRNATMRASTGQHVMLLDTSIELAGDIWTPLEAALADPAVGIAGPYGLTTTDLREFGEAPGPDVDAIEGYLIAFRRANLVDIGQLDEKFRFYRLADVYWSFSFKAAGLRALAVADVAERVHKHPHREWYSLAPEEQQTKSKKNFDLLRDRWHHGESLLVQNAATTERWTAHDDGRHIQATHTHAADELPPHGEPHSHAHRHLHDHEHTHRHYHSAVPGTEETRP